MVVLMLGVATALAAGRSSGISAASTGLKRQVLHPLHVARDPHHGAWIFDDDRRSVRLRAVNVNQLGDYYQVDPSSPTVFPLTDRDGARIAELGFDAVRLVVSWSHLEPRPGVIDESAVAEVVGAIDMFARHDLYVVVDMHQDAWGKWTASPPGAACAEPMTPAIGWDGAPRWATIAGTSSTCITAGIRESSPAVLAAWEAFLDDRPAPDGVGLQTHLVRVWGAIAGRLATRSEVAGYDLLNEPFVGFAEPAARLTQLGRFYRRSIEAIRRAEDAIPDGIHHLVFFEPDVVWSGLGRGALVPPGFSTDPDLVFSPHLYGGSISVSSVAAGFDAAVDAAHRYDTPIWSGEYGWFGDPQAQVRDLRRFAERLDASGVGAAWWDWRQACGDPHLHGVVGKPGEPVAVGLVRYRCPGDHEIGIPPPFRTVLSRPYARAAPGLLTRLEPDDDAGTLVLTGDAALAGGSGKLDLWLPAADGQPAVTGATDVNVVRVPGGFRVTGEVTGRYAVHVTRRDVPSPPPSTSRPSAASPASTRGIAGSWWIVVAVLVALGTAVGLVGRYRWSRDPR